MMKKTWRMLNQDAGAALMMAIFTVTMLMILATEVMYESNVEYVVSAQNVGMVKAHYAAKAGVQISLLRLYIYKKVMASVGQQMAAQLPMLDMIWQMPFAWPPIVPPETNGVTKDEIKATVKKSAMQGSYMATIESEGNKIDLSLLASTNVNVVKSTEQQILQIFTTRMRDDQLFADKHSGEDWNKIIQNIRDYVSPGEKGDSGQDKRSLYSNINNDKIQFPPAQPFKTFQELHMVAGMTDEIYDMLLPRVTIYGSKALNVKYASKETLMAGLNLTADQAAKVIEDRNKQDTQSFKDVKSFFGLLEALGVRQEDLVDSQTNQPKYNVIVDPEFNFRIKSLGSSGKITKDITAIVYDYDKVLAQLKALNPAPSPTPTPPNGNLALTPTPTPTPTPSTGSTQPANGPPTIVYWNEQ